MRSKHPMRDTYLRELLYREGMTYVQAASASGFTAGVVAGVAHRTPHRLRRELARQA